MALRSQPELKRRVGHFNWVSHPSTPKKLILKSETPEKPKENAGDDVSDS